MGAGSNTYSAQWAFLRESFTNKAKDWHLALCPFYPALSIFSQLKVFDIIVKRFYSRHLSVPR
jgi:hypothetical protein